MIHELILQIGIAVTGLIAITLALDRREERQRFACWFGLLGQPLWLYTTATEAQWGMFALSCAYTFVWAFNAWTHWGLDPRWRA